jgi:CDP-paratose 2-epimerase
MKIIIIGGAGFIGSSLALAFKEQSSSHQLVALDNLKRRGSELNLPIFKELGIEFVHADIRDPADFDEISNREFDLMIEASAEPSVLAGLGGSPTYVLGTNLVGTLNCLEFARKRVQQLVFLSTSRVYSIQPLLQIRLNESDSRFELEAEQNTRGVSTYGISEKFPLSVLALFTEQPNSQRSLLSVNTLALTK